MYIDDDNNDDEGGNVNLELFKTIYMQMQMQFGVTNVLCLVC